ncbi:hypothetical protein I5Q34_13495 [Streptomyces sp. AV19]|uniref:hypothetical protein n=1 Tax=Streptomyces sp. AV19 TaxID=2793068 RepID=UPI0018FE9220|nr:hypothetical protein [Streptomyces sp. AV19]MBH1935274.1 hypothetical protein [Streptomyces sp. AV19]MDG4531161.1 hypothetical protein [Streptomyces sp. AV19]
MIHRALPLLIPYAICCFLVAGGLLPPGVLLAVPVASAVYGAVVRGRRGRRGSGRFTRTADGPRPRA